MSEGERLIRIFPALSGRDLTVEDMDLEVAVRNALKRGGIHTLAQLLRLSHPELLAVFPNRKLRSYEEVIHRLVRLSEEEGRTGAAAPGFTFVGDVGNTLEGVKTSGKKFNIFQVAGIWKSEEIHTSVIAELINPKSAFHDKGAVFLDKFLQKTGAMRLSREELEGAAVSVEVPTDMGRRIDMVISTTRFYLPFEVKIWAGDQEAQLWHYYDFATREGEKRGQKVPCVYYLTPDRHEPSAWSRKDLTDEQLRRLSFKEDILPWLEECIEDCENAPDAPLDVLEIMKQLRGNIKGQPGGQGFSAWTRGVLDVICGRLSEKYDVPWTECTNRYKMFTLNKEGPLELALRFEKDSEGLVWLYLICGLTRGKESPDYTYAATSGYIAQNPGKFVELLEATFRDGGGTLGIKAEPDAWNLLPKKGCYEKLDADGCCREIEKIFEALNPKPGQALKK